MPLALLGSLMWVAGCENSLGGDKGGLQDPRPSVSTDGSVDSGPADSGSDAHVMGVTPGVDAALADAGVDGAVHGHEVDSGAGGDNAVDPCAFKGVPLFGRVRVVENFVVDEIKIAYVDTAPDIKVRWVDFHGQANSCGIWNRDNNFYKFTVRVVDARSGFPDLRVKNVTGTTEQPGWTGIRSF